MLRKFISWVILLLITAVVVSFAVANRNNITVSLDPVGITNPPLTASLKLWVLALGMAILGVIIGGIAVWLRQSVIGVDDLGGNPATLAAQQVIALYPGDRSRSIEMPDTGAQCGRVHDARRSCEIAVRGMAQGTDLLGMKPFTGLHQGRSHRLRQVETLALGYRHRAGIRPYRHRDRDADPIEPGYVAEPRDPHPLGEGADLGQGLARCRRPMRAAMKPLRQPRVQDPIERACFRDRQRDGSNRAQQ